MGHQSAKCKLHCKILRAVYHTMSELSLLYCCYSCSLSHTLPVVLLSLSVNVISQSLFQMWCWCCNMSVCEQNVL